MEKQFFKKRRSAQMLYSFGYCTILLLEYDSVEDVVVNFTAYEHQTPTITVNLNRIIDKSLKHIVKDSKVWQEFHLNDSGKKRSFVLQFEKGQEFDEFFIKLSEVLSWLHACKKGKLSVDKKYYLVGFRDNPKEVITQISFDGKTDSEKRESFSSDSSENSTNDVIDSSFVTTPPFSPKPFNTLQISRVIGLDKELSLGLLKRPKSEENKKGRYHEQIFGSMLQPVPPSGISIFETHSKHSNDSDLNYSVNITELDLDKNGTVKHADFCQSVNITEIDSNCDFRQTVDITQLDFDNIKGEAGNQRDVLIGDEVVDTTMKARQEQNQLKQYAQLLQAAINDGDQENARQYADILAASHLKIAITVDENSLKVEVNSQDIKIKVVIEDKECQGGSLLLSVKLTDTIGDLKAKMFFKHKFPIEVQKWIVGKRIPKDEGSLQRLRVTNDQTVYLYLVTAKSVGLDKQQHMATSGYIDMTVSDKGMPPMVPAVPHHVPQQPMNQLSSTPTKAPVRVDKHIQGAPVEPPPRGAVFNPVTQAEHEVAIEKPPKRQEPDGSQIANIKGQDADSKQQIGWHCLACTFLNLPTRPGCEMCSHPRPKDYKIPENYKMSKEEVERIKREEDDERKAQQAAAERRAREREPAENIYNQELTEQEIHHLLTLNDEMQRKILQSRQTGGQEHEFKEGVQIPRGAVQQPENLENIQFTIQPGQHLDFSQENDESI